MSIYDQEKIEFDFSPELRIILLLRDFNTGIAVDDDDPSAGIHRLTGKGLVLGDVLKSALIHRDLYRMLVEAYEAGVQEGLDTASQA